MVVDDEAPIRSLVQRSLNQFGYSVISVPDGESALKRYREPAGRPSLIILDIGMPGMDGWQCLAKLRALDSHVKVLLATGYGREDFIARALQLGAVGILFKPYMLTELSEKVRELLDAPAP